MFSWTGWSIGHLNRYNLADWLCKRCSSHIKSNVLQWKSTLYIYIPFVINRQDVLQIFVLYNYNWNRINSCKIWIVLYAYCTYNYIGYSYSPVLLDLSTTNPSGISMKDSELFRESLGNLMSCIFSMLISSALMTIYTCSIWELFLLSL